eukprot:gnl/Dysnectes_brevis/581_a643_3342.p1 GENE.gnl/Dysnectes_brevis/581_a643_3342~~gnl/Dysnectes_brevis/581_a643_3342.p1  ORF type:complete len:127 (+),score=6.56 gnl/Dysnectes_brevis/581_a643_3342:96-476(+)
MRHKVGTPKLRESIAQLFGSARLIWNSAIKECNDQWGDDQTKWPHPDEVMLHLRPLVKAGGKLDPEHCPLSSHSRQSVIHSLVASLKAERTKSLKSLKQRTWTGYKYLDDRLQAQEGQPVHRHPRC